MGVLTARFPIPLLTGEVFFVNYLDNAQTYFSGTSIHLTRLNRGQKGKGFSPIVPMQRFHTKLKTHKRLHKSIAQRNQESSFIAST